MSSLAAELAATPDVVEALLAAHRADERGRCRTCSDRSSRPAWPCRLYALAEQARDLAARPGGVGR